MTRAAVEQNPAAWFEVLALQPGATADPATRSVLTTVPFGLCNSIFFPSWAGDEADARVEAMLGQSRARDVPRLWWLGDDQGRGGLADRLDARGVIRHGESMPAMALDDLSALPAGGAPDGLRVDRVCDRAALTAFGGPFGEAYGITGAALTSMVEAFAAYGLGGDVRHWVGRVGARPVASASVIVRDGVAGLYNVGTVQDGRRRGYGTAVTVAALRGARQAGAHGAILHASPEGLPIYRRLGFTTVSEVHAVETSG